MRRRREVIDEGVWVHFPKRMHDHICCDCGLTHQLDIRVVRMPNGRSRVEMRWRKDREATRRERNKHAIRISVGRPPRPPA